MSGDYVEYDPDDGRSDTPPFAAIRPRGTPSPERPPYEYLGGSLPQNVKLLPAIGQANFVLCKLLDPNRPDIAQQAREIELSADTDCESDMEDQDMDSRSQTVEATPVPLESAQARHSQAEVANVDLQATAQKALNSTSQGTASSLPTKQQSNDHRDSVVEIDGQPRSGYDSERRASHTASTTALTNGTVPSINSADSKPPTTASQVESRSLSVAANLNANGVEKQESLATSPNLAQLTIPPSKGSPSQKLAAFQPPPSPSFREGPAGSPNQERKLPSFRHFSELADSARTDQQDPSRANGYPHRQSISSSTQSPTSAARQLSISSSRSPGSAYPASSPISAASETASRDIFLRSGQSGLTFLSTRRPSQASESGPYSATIHSASTTESYQSSDGLSPGTLVTPIEGRARHMSIDGALRTLPPPNGPHIQHIPPHGAGGFKCDHPGCTAPPFQTQYLLNSHANVHSQSRPHYCPVANCPRGEGGKGFKRKNEMIRHGLVHQSPGYVCPFCPDREHKYPRPDNLQRHVRVHHVDKDKDDPQLREVLAQRPEGGSRGRRRRVGS